MKNSAMFPRRRFVNQLKWVPVLLLAGCGSDNKTAEKKSEHVPTQCDDYTGLEENDLKLRENFGYVTESPLEESHCKNCNLYKPAAEGHTCGGCTLFKGPVFENAYCTYWAPIVNG